MTAMHLGDLGAQVVKVEHPRRPDPARGHGPEKDGHNLWYKTLGRNKRSVQLDLSSPGGAEAFRRLAARADVVVENFRPDTLERWGLSYERLSRAQPRPRPRADHRLRPDRARTAAGPGSARWPRR